MTLLSEHWIPVARLSSRQIGSTGAILRLFLVTRVGIPVGQPASPICYAMATEQVRCVKLKVRF